VCMYTHTMTGFTQKSSGERKEEQERARELYSSYCSNPRAAAQEGDSGGQCVQDADLALSLYFSATRRVQGLRAGHASCEKIHTSALFAILSVLSHSLSLPPRTGKDQGKGGR